MSWDENVCAKSPAPEFEIPEDESVLEQLLEAIGYTEIEVSATDSCGGTVTITVIGKRQSADKVCSAKVCQSTVG